MKDGCWQARSHTLLTFSRIRAERNIFDEMQALYFHIHQLGYRKMPDEMYLSWLNELNTQRDKYSNKEIQDINTIRK